MGREKDLDLLLLLLLLVVCPRLPLFFFQENLHDRWRWNWEGTGPGHSGGGVKVSFLLLLVAFSPTFFSSLKVLRLLRLWEFDDCVFLSPTSRFQTCWNREFDNQNGKTRFFGGSYRTIRTKFRVGGLSTFVWCMGGERTPTTIQNGRFSPVTFFFCFRILSFSHLFGERRIKMVGGKNVKSWGDLHFRETHTKKHTTKGREKKKKRKDPIKR